MEPELHDRHLNFAEARGVPKSSSLTFQGSSTGQLVVPAIVTSGICPRLKRGDPISCITPAQIQLRKWRRGQGVRNFNHRVQLQLVSHEGVEACINVRNSHTFETNITERSLQCLFMVSIPKRLSSLPYCLFIAATRSLSIRGGFINAFRLILDDLISCCVWPRLVSSWWRGLRNGARGKN